MVVIDPIVSWQLESLADQAQQSLADQGKGLSAQTN
jgi:hypothetical protein